jgi:hypothetical protein
VGGGAAGAVFFGDHAEGFYKMLLISMNECEGKDTFDFEG